MATKQTTGKAGQPETLNQVRWWDHNKTNYVKNGWCDKCAAQAAWGHQIGFTKIDNGPCEKCVGLPVPAKAGARAARWAAAPEQEESS